MKSRFWCSLVIAVVIGTLYPRDGLGQWVSQEFTLHPGWNSVYLEIQPFTKECDAAFSRIPIEGLWYYNSRVPTMQFFDDPAKMVEVRPGWMAYYPPSSPNRAAADFFQLIGGRPYLIKLGGSNNVVWQITGSVVQPSPDWIADVKNFVGFPVDDNQPPTFEEFFSSSSSHVGQPVYRLNSTTGKWESADPSTSRMRRGEAFWIQTSGAASFSGPLTVSSEFGEGLEFGRKTVEITVDVTNHSSQSREVAFRLAASSDAPSTTSQQVAGSVPLSYYIMNLSAQIIGWFPLSDSYSISVDAGQTKQVRFQVRRKDFAAPAPHSGSEPLYQSLLMISDDSGALRILPVSSYGLPPTVVQPHINMPYVMRMGLWVGTAQVDSVCETNNTDDRLTPKSVSSPFNFPLLLHADSQSNVRLLSEVYVMAKTSSQMAASKSTTAASTPSSSSRLVLLTDRSLLSQYQGVTAAGQDLVGRRFSSAAFGTSPPDAVQSAPYHHSLNSTQFPIVTTADSQETSPILRCTIVIDYDDPLNPFKHKYHPDHDNLSERFDSQLTEGVESYQITRLVELEFTRNDPYNRSSVSGWGDTVIGGHYTETVTGIHRYPIRSRGNFIMRYILGTSTLNDQ